MVQLSELARPGHRGIDAAAGTPLAEVLDLSRDDLLLSEAQIRVRGKGNKTRFLPLAPEATQLLDHYLRLERPQTSTNALFVSLKGPAAAPDDSRGIALTCFDIIVGLPA